MTTRPGFGSSKGRDASLQPWLPPADPLAAKLNNEIVLAEVTDEVAAGRYLNHFALHLAAMD